MTDEWLNETENFGTRRERLLEEIEAVLSRFGGDILDNGPKGSMRYLSDHLGDLVVRWAGGAMCHEREAAAKVCDEFGDDYMQQAREGDQSGASDHKACAATEIADALRARSSAPTDTPVER